MTVKRILVAGIACPLLAFSHARAQGTAAESVAAPAAPLRVFLNCPTCDFDYIRTAIPWVDYVRDPRQAQVHLLVTILRTAPGGRRTRSPSSAGMHSRGRPTRCTGLPV